MLLSQSKAEGSCKGFKLYKSFPKKNCDEVLYTPSVRIFSPNMDES